ncbi:GFA family protein [Sphingobium sp. LMC3-1-1.1]|uniref:GFA family protein n=1 Tax=unclassified Sphingobium TaxID=2611147 RepID=UPI00341C23D4
MANSSEHIRADSNIPMSLSGSCDCGAVTYTMKVCSLQVYACHCLNCQTRSGCTFAEHAMVHASAFVCEGEVEAYCREANDIHFEEVVCRNCYTRLFNRNSLLPGTIFLRAGTLFESERLEPIAHIWVKRKQRWVLLADGVPLFAESPTPEEFGAAIALADARGKDQRPQSSA